MNRLEILQQMEAQKPNDEFVKFAIALEYVKDKKYDTAKNIFHDLTKKFSTYLPTYYQYGKLLELLNENRKAAEIYKAGTEQAKAVNDLKTLSELTEAIELLE
jgi:predicted Zn-dependent protease